MLLQCSCPPQVLVQGQPSECPQQHHGTYPVMLKLAYGLRNCILKAKNTEKHWAGLEKGTGQAYWHFSILIAWSGSHRYCHATDA
ncbi:hypothetical protein V5799_025514 [Amblyomma americanum]|uniref:Uncharacterized protein n=1 Tax=Amblyomma americanum TaxID=6943 RepID=A0AAQ4E9B6_AMBAM